MGPERPIISNQTKRLLSFSENFPEHSNQPRKETAGTGRKPCITTPTSICTILACLPPRSWRQLKGYYSKNKASYSMRRGKRHEMSFSRTGFFVSRFNVAKLEIHPREGPLCHGTGHAASQ